jgi:hypothetical protein
VLCRSVSCRGCGGEEASLLKLQCGGEHGLLCDSPHERAWLPCLLWGHVLLGCSSDPPLSSSTHPAIGSTSSLVAIVRLDSSCGSPTSMVPPLPPTSCLEQTETDMQYVCSYAPTKSQHE